MNKEQIKVTIWMFRKKPNGFKRVQRSWFSRKVTFTLPNIPREEEWQRGYPNRYMQLTVTNEKGKDADRSDEIYLKFSRMYTKDPINDYSLIDISFESITHIGELLHKWCM